MLSSSSMKGNLVMMFYDHRTGKKVPLQRSPVPRNYDVSFKYSLQRQGKLRKSDTKLPSAVRFRVNVLKNCSVSH